MKDQLCYAPGTKVIFREKPEDEGQICHVHTALVENGVVEYNLYELGAWFSHDQLEFVEFPTKESLLLISSDEDEYYEEEEYEDEDEIMEELYHRDESGDR